MLLYSAAQFVIFQRLEKRVTVLIKRKRRVDHPITSESSHRKAIAILLYRDVLPIQTDNLKDVTSKSFKNMKSFVDEKCAAYKKFLAGDQSTM